MQEHQPFLLPAHLERLGPEDWKELGKGDAHSVPFAFAGVEAVAVGNAVPSRIGAEDHLVALPVALLHGGWGAVRQPQGCGQTKPPILRVPEGL